MITAEDVFQALKELDFEKYEEPLREFQKNYNAEKEDQARRIGSGKKLAPMQDNEDADMEVENDSLRDGTVEQSVDQEFKRIKTDE